MCSTLGVSDEKILAVADFAQSPLFDDDEKVALHYADAMTLSGEDVDNELFEQLRAYFDDDAIVELTAVVAWENASSKFNRALRVEAQGLWGPR